MKDWHISPRFMMRELHAGTISNIDVFEDAILGWFFKFANALVSLQDEHAGMAIMTVIAAYPEMIECYSTGEDSKNHSSEFYQKGLVRIFPFLSTIPQDAVKSINSSIRNGIYHTIMLKPGVHLNASGQAVQYDPLDGIVRLNPFQLLQVFEKHFNDYVERLRSGAAGDPEFDNFNRYWQFHFSQGRNLAPNIQTLLPQAQSTSIPSSFPAISKSANTTHAPTLSPIPTLKKP